MKKGFAFTLVEIMFAMAIIGVISAIAASGLKNIMPDENRIRFQKCYSKMMEVVEILHNDEENYPKIPYMNSDGTPIKVNGETKLYGFANKYYLDPLSTSNDSYIPKFKSNKFGFLFSKEFAVSQVTYDTTYYYRFIAKDLSYWTINELYLTSNNKNYAVITFDVDGLSKGTNCPVTGAGLSSNVTNCTKPDTFSFVVYANATVKEVDNLGGFNQAEFLQNNNYYGNQQKKQ